MLKIVEVGPRDGLQNETAAIATDAKIKFINALSRTGVHEIEVSAFVSPRWVPQLGDAREVFARITRKKGVTYSALVPNERGLDEALAAKVDKIAVFTAASETFNRKNINASIKSSIQRLHPVVTRAAGAELPVRGYISTESVVPALEARGETTGVDPHKLAKKLAKAHRHIAPYLIDELRSKPERDLPACASCEYATETICCRRKASGDV